MQFSFYCDTVNGLARKYIYTPCPCGDDGVFVMVWPKCVRMCVLLLCRELSTATFWAVWRHVFTKDEIKAEVYVGGFELADDSDDEYESD